MSAPLRCVLLITAVVAVVLAGCGRDAPVASVNVDRPPVTPAYRDHDVVYAVDVPIDANQPVPQPVAVRYSSAPDLPAGLELDPTTGVIRGVPRVVQPATGHVITAANVFGKTSVTVTITVKLPAARFALLANAAGELCSYRLVDAASDAGTLELRSVAVLDAPVTGVAIAPRGDVAYALHGAERRITVVRLDAATGALRASASIATSGNPTSLAIDRAGRFAYLTQAGVPRITRFAVDPNDAVLVDGVEADTGVDPQGLVLDRASRFAYVVAATSRNVWVHTVDPVDGTLTVLEALPTGDDPRSLALDVDGGFLYVANRLNGDLSVYAVNSRTGRLVPLARAATVAEPVQVRVDVVARSVWVLSTTSGQLQEHAIQPNGTLAMRQQIDLGAGAPAFAVADRVVHALRDDGATVQRFVEDARGVLRPTAPQPTRGGTVAIELDRAVFALAAETRSVFVVDRVRDMLTRLEVALAEGGFRAVQTLATGRTPQNAIVHPSRRFLFVSNQASNDLLVQTLDPSSGAFVESPTEGLSGVREQASGPSPMAIDATGRFLYVGLVDSHEVAIVEVNVDSSTLRLVEVMPTELSPLDLRVDPTSRFLLVLNAGSRVLSLYAIDAHSGRLTLLDTAMTQPFPAALAVHPGGRFAYVANAFEDTVTSFVIEDRRLRRLETQPAGRFPSALEVHPGGRWLLVAREGAAEVAAFAIDGASGKLLGVTTALTGAEPTAVAWDGSGRNAFVVSQGAGLVELLSFDLASGALTRLGTAAAGVQPVDVTPFDVLVPVR